MSAIPQLIVRAADVVRYQGELAQPIELGRQEHAEPTALFTVGPPFRSDGHPRLILAPFEATQNLSRHHLRLAVEPDGRLRIKNQSEQPLFTAGKCWPPARPTTSRRLWSFGCSTPSSSRSTAPGRRSLPRGSAGPCTASIGR